MDLSFSSYQSTKTKTGLPTLNSLDLSFKSFQDEQKGIRPVSKQPVGEVPTLLQGNTNFSGTLQSLVDLENNPLNLPTAETKNPFVAAWDSLKTSVENGAEKVAEYLIARTPSEKVGKLAGAVSGIAGSFFSPITALFEGANQVPVLGSVSKLISLPFQAAGEGGANIGGAVVDALPVSQQVKDNLKPGIQEIFSLAGQLALGRVGDVVFKATLPSERAAAKIRTEIVSENPNVKAKLEAIPTNKINQLVETHGVTDAKTIIKEAIRFAEEKTGGQTTPSMITETPKTKLSQVVESQGADLSYGKFQQDQVKPINQVEGVGETKVRTLAQGVEQNAIEKKLTAGFGDLPEYQSVNMKQQAQLASDLLTNDPIKARKVAMGEEIAPQGIIPEAVFIALEDLAIKNGDVATLKELATASKLTVEATTMGQRIRTLGERSPESPVGAITEIAKVREEVARKANKDITKAKESIKAEIRAEIQKNTPKIKTWEEFVKSIEC